MWDLRRLKRVLCGIAAGLVLVSCGSDDSAPVRPEITPQDFALVPCGPSLAERPCALVVAGGKRVLFGAPAGVAATLTQEDLRGLDAVMLFSLRAVDIEGLDEVRNETWWAGRDEPLLVAGPEGTTQLVEALNKAFEQSDALRVVEEGIPKGGYDAAILEAPGPIIGAADAALFDTGDLRVQRFDQTFVVRYNSDTFLVLTSCKETEAFKSDDAKDDVQLIVDCVSDAAMRWPLTETVFIVKN
jgi:ribonuclease BN (tRNA processing enzyme)